MTTDLFGDNLNLNDKQNFNVDAATSAAAGVIINEAEEEKEGGMYNNNINESITNTSEHIQVEKKVKFEEEETATLVLIEVNEEKSINNDINNSNDNYNKIINNNNNDKLYVINEENCLFNMNKDKENNETMPITRSFSNNTLLNTSPSSSSLADSLSSSSSKSKIQSGLTKRENKNSDSDLNERNSKLDSELHKNMQKIINGNLSPPSATKTTQKFILNNSQHNLTNKLEQSQQQSSLTSSQLNDYYKLNNLNETSMPIEMMMTLMSLNGSNESSNEDDKIKKSYSREMTPDSIDSSLTNSINGSVVDIIKNNNKTQNILDSHYFITSSSVEELNFNLEKVLNPTTTVPLQLNQNYLQQQLLLLQQQQQQQHPAILLQQQLYNQQLQQLVIKQQQQLLQLQQLQTTTNTQPIIQQQQQQKSQIPIPVLAKKKPEEQLKQQINSDNDEMNNYKKIKRYPEILNTKSAAGIGKRLAYAVSTDLDDNNSEKMAADEYDNIESKIVKIEDDRARIMPRLEEGLSNDDDDCDHHKKELKHKKSDFIYKKTQESTTNKGNFEKSSSAQSISSSCSSSISPSARLNNNKIINDNKLKTNNCNSGTNKNKSNEKDYDTDEETNKLLSTEINVNQNIEKINNEEEEENEENYQRINRNTKTKEILTRKIMDPDSQVLIEGVLFRARYLGSTQLDTDSNPTKLTRMMQAQEAVGRIKAPEGESQPNVEVDLFVSTEKIMVLNTDLQEIMMDHSLRSISYIADIGDLVVLMAKRRNFTNPENTIKRQQKLICHVFESEEAQTVAQSIGQAFQVAYIEYLKANGIEDVSIMKDLDYQEVLNQQEIMGDELNMFAKKEHQKEVIVPKAKNEALGLVIVESGWGSMIPTVVVANMMPNGPAARCGLLNIGDQVISVNGISMVGLPLSSCQEKIKSTKHLTLVRLVVVPCPPVVEVLIKRPDTKYQLGFSVQDGIICSLLRGGIAERGGVRVGHRIIEINNQSVVATVHEKIVNMLANSVGELRMKTMPTQIFRLLTGQENPNYI